MVWVGLKHVHFFLLTCCIYADIVGGWVLFSIPSKSRWPAPLSIINGVGAGIGIAIEVADTGKSISVVTKVALYIVVTVMMSSKTVSSSIS